MTFDIMIIFYINDTQMHSVFNLGGRGERIVISKTKIVVGWLMSNNLILLPILRQSGCNDYIYKKTRVKYLI